MTLQQRFIGQTECSAFHAAKGVTRARFLGVVQCYLICNNELRQVGLDVYHKNLAKMFIVTTSATFVQESLGYKSTTKC